MDREEQGSKRWCKRWLAISLMVLIAIGLFFSIFLFIGNLCMENKLIDERIPDLDFFGGSSPGVICMGEKNYEVALASGGKRQISCIISSKNQTEYFLEVEKIASLSGESQEEVDSWIVATNWTGEVDSGKKVVPVAVLDISQKIEPTNLNITLKEKDINNGAEQIHNLYIDVRQIGSEKPVICKWFQRDSNAE